MTKQTHISKMKIREKYLIFAAWILMIVGGISLGVSTPLWVEAKEHHYRQAYVVSQLVPEAKERLQIAMIDNRLTLSEAREIIDMHSWKRVVTNEYQ